MADVQVLAEQVNQITGLGQADPYYEYVIKLIADTGKTIAAGTYDIFVAFEDNSVSKTIYQANVTTTIINDSTTFTLGSYFSTSTTSAVAVANASAKVYNL
ncbi:MAG: hypothetical protein ACRCWY_12640 [Cellulosilyticaceae bacterium]